MRTQIARREKLMPATGIQLTVALEYATGKRVSSRIPGAPDQIYYSLTGGRETHARAVEGVCGACGGTTYNGRCTNACR